MNRSFKTAILAAAAVIPAATMFVSASASNPNLVTNGTFTGGVAGWTASASPLGSISAGPGNTALVKNLVTGASTTQASGLQCVNGVSAGTKYTLSADTLIPSGQTRHGGAQTRVFFFAGANCSGAAIEAPQGSFVIALDAWTAVSNTFLAPAGTTSARVQIMSQKYIAGAGEDPNADFRVYWDNVKFAEYEAPATPTNTPTKTPTQAPTNTPIPPTNTPVPPTNTPVPPTNTPVPPTATVQPTDTPSNTGGTEDTPGNGSSADSTPDDSGNADNNTPSGPTETTHTQDQTTNGGAPQAPDTGNGHAASRPMDMNMLWVAALLGSFGVGLSAVAVLMARRREDE